MCTRVTWPGHVPGRVLRRCFRSCARSREGASFAHKPAAPGLGVGLGTQMDHYLKRVILQAKAHQIDTHRTLHLKRAGVAIIL